MYHLDLDLRVHMYALHIWSAKSTPPMFWLYFLTAKEHTTSNSCRPVIYEIPHPCICIYKQHQQNVPASYFSKQNSGRFQPGLVWLSVVYFSMKQTETFQNFKILSYWPLLLTKNYFECLWINPLLPQSLVASTNFPA